MKEIPDHWKEWVKDFALAQSNGKRTHLNLYDFTSSVRILFPDGSFAFFEYAFCTADEDRHELAVFTEHCGYHIFPLEEIQFTQLRSVHFRGPAINGSVAKPGKASDS